jgi:uncharacterized protein YjbJ (UPF0337 family)
MRFLIRLAVLALAAVGAKALYDRFAPKAAELREPVSGVIDTAKGAARDVSGHAKDAASEVVDDAKQRAAEVKDQAQQAARTASSDDAPTIGVPSTPPAPHNSSVRS